MLHTASPYILTVTNPQQDLVVSIKFYQKKSQKILKKSTNEKDPAVNGTINVLEICNELDVKRVVLTSSVAAITDSPVNDHLYTEEDWNTQSTLTRNPYYFSKTVAERAAWDFKRNFKLLVINVFFGDVSFFLVFLKNFLDFQSLSLLWDQLWMTE